MARWDSASHDQRGASLDGATIKRVRALSGRVAGVLWYQGESDANPDDLPLDKECLTRLFAASRADLARPDWRRARVTTVLAFYNIGVTITC